ncbi:MAG: GDSL-type esterase/lipase family protein [Anaerolineales bacterium]|nr:GDSL-type esterase/lipase family protein [Anaerolineales bacterium]
MHIFPLLITILFTAFLLVACTTPTSAPPPVTPTIRYLAVGDSYTIGESVPENERWPVQLRAKLQESGYQVELTVIARTGWTTDELWEGIEQTGVIPPYDLVSLLIGVNNQYRGRPLQEYREQFRFLVEKAIEYAGNEPKHVIVVSIPDWGVTPFAAGRGSERISAEIDAFNQVNREEAESAGCIYVDITPYSRTALSDRTLLASDGLHPSGKMYAGWVERILPAALEAVK